MYAVSEWELKDFTKNQEFQKNLENRRKLFKKRQDEVNRANISKLAK